MTSLFLVAFVAKPAHVIPALLLYIGPDVFMPLTSALAAITGLILLFWRKTVVLASKLWRLVSRRSH